MFVEYSVEGPVDQGATTAAQLLSCSETPRESGLKPDPLED